MRYSIYEEKCFIKSYGVIVDEHDNLHVVLKIQSRTWSGNFLQHFCVYFMLYLFMIPSCPSISHDIAFLGRKWLKMTAYAILYGVKRMAIPMTLPLIKPVCSICFFFYMTGYIKTRGNAKRYVFHFRFIQLENKQWKQNQLNREES